MGVKVTGYSLEAFVDDINKSVKKRMVQVVKDLHKEVTKIEYRGDMLVNPKITGRLQASWAVSPDGTMFDAGTGTHGPASLVFPATFTDTLHMTNGCPYSGFVERGVNALYPNSEAVAEHTNFVKRAIHRVTK